MEVRPVDINYSIWDNLLEESKIKVRKKESDQDYCPIRLGFRQVKGLREEEMQLLVNARDQHYTNIHSLLDAGLSLVSLEKLADADAFRSIGLDRRQALWEVSALSDRPIGLFQGHASESASEPQVHLPLMTASEHVVQDYASTSLSLKAHPVSFVRDKLEALKVFSAKQLDLVGNAMPVKAAGLVLVRQRPGTASGICFITIEDETGCANLVVFQKLFTKYRKEILNARLLMVEGKLQREGDVTHVIVSKCHDMSVLLRKLTATEDENPDILTLARADEKDEYASQAVARGGQGKREVQTEIFPSGRNFR